jgi:hypothetical protein
MISLKAARSNALYIGYASPNTAVTSDPTYRELLAYNYDTDRISAWDILYGKTKDEANANYSYSPAYEDFYKDETVDIQVHINSLWESLKTENSTELWIHITSATIIASVIALAVYNYYIKRKRSKDYRLRDKQKQQKNNP